MAKHFDVVVVGAGLGALTAAALLARRSWRVLVVGHGHKPSSYTMDGMPLLRRPFTFLAGTSPAWTRVLVELAQSQTWKRRVEPLFPMFQVLGAGLRLDVPPDSPLFAGELEREFADSRRTIEDLYMALAEANGAVDAAFDKDLVWPPGGFWERREVERALETLPFLGAGAEASVDLLNGLSESHVYRSILATPASFSSHLGTSLPTFALARLHGAWTRGIVGVARGEEGLAEFLLERVRAHGGETRLGDRVTRILHRRGKVAGVIVDRDDEPTGVQFVVTDRTTRSLLELSEGFEPKRSEMEQLPQLAPRYDRFVVSLLVRKEGVPAALAREAFLLPERGAQRNGARGAELRRPALAGGTTGAVASLTARDATRGASVGAVHLQRHSSASCGSSPVPEGMELLVAETRVACIGASGPRGGMDGSAEGADRLALARERVLAVIEEFLPFVEQHYVLVDSPHDGRPLWDYRSGSRVAVDRVGLRSGGVSAGPEPMMPAWEVAPPVFFGLGAEPIQSPLGGAFVVGPSVLPALGQEGELLAAWGAARRITRTDSRKEKMRRDMWSKVELG